MGKDSAVNKDDAVRLRRSVGLLEGKEVVVVVVVVVVFFVFVIVFDLVVFVVFIIVPVVNCCHCRCFCNIFRCVLASL